MSAARAAFLGVRRIYRKDTVRIGFEMSTAPTSSVGWKRTWTMFVVDRAGSNAFSRLELVPKFSALRNLKGLNFVSTEEDVLHHLNQQEVD